jgi:hypothetical protein
MGIIKAAPHLYIRLSPLRRDFFCLSAVPPFKVNSVRAMILHTSNKF